MTAGRLLSVVAAVVVALAATSTVHAAEPATLGGTLGATASELVIDSSATVPVSVTIVMPQGWAVAESSLTMQPGDHRTVAITQAGPSGQILAVIAASDPPVGVDSSTLVLALGIAPPAPDYGPLVWAFLFIFAAVAAVATWRYRRGR